jgi:MarR family 2-MHQ and catechol resistance regulon transcriptional repressor
MKMRDQMEVTDQRTNYYWERLRKYGKRYKDFHWDSSELVLNLIYTHDVFLSRALRIFSELNLSVSGINILIILKHDEDTGRTQQELSSLLLVSRANITKVIDGLEKRRLVIRTSSKKDRRARVIKLTSAGEKLADHIIPIQNKASTQITAGLSQEEKKLLSKLLAKFRKSIVESEEIK